MLSQSPWAVGSMRERTLSTIALAALAALEALRALRMAAPRCWTTVMNSPLSQPSSAMASVAGWPWILAL